MRILFVENHAAFTSVVVPQFLGGHEVVITPTLFGARAAMRLQGFDAVLVDFDLDDGKGDALVRELVAAHFMGPIVAVSSHAEGNAALRAAGATAVCAKADFARLAGLLAERRQGP